MNRKLVWTGAIIIGSALFNLAVVGEAVPLLVVLATHLWAAVFAFLLGLAMGERWCDLYTLRWWGTVSVICVAGVFFGAQLLPSMTSFNGMGDFRTILQMGTYAALIVSALAAFSVGLFHRQGRSEWTSED